MEAETFVGLDVHRKTVVATALTADGKTIDQSTLGPSKGELTAYLQGLPGRVHAVLEACTMWEPYYEAAAAAGATVAVSNPYKTRLIAEATIKTDKVDSRSLATLLRLDAVPRTFVPPPELRELRRLVREWVFYQRRLTALKNHTYGALLKRGVAYPDRALQLKHTRAELREFGIPEVNRALDVIDDLLKRRKELDAEMKAAYDRSPEAQLLTTIPGIGRITAVVLAAFLSPIERFRNVDQVASYAGMAPSTHQSGEFSYQGHLKHDCNALLQWILIECSWTHRQRARNSDVAKVGRRVSRRRGKGKGTVAAAHKLLKIIYAILKEKRPYLPHAPERPAASQGVRDPPRVAASQCVRGTALGPSTANRLLAH